MKKGIVFILSALLTSALLVGCGMFDADPTIDSFSATATSIEAGESITVSIVGSTRDASVESDLVDYSGTIEITCSAAGISEEIAIDSFYATGFTATQNLTFSTAGTYTLTATLSSGSSTAFKTLEITVTDSTRPWDDETVYTISSRQIWIDGYSISPALDVDWFKYSTSQSYYIIHWQDSLDYLSSAYGADVKVTVYNAAGDVIGGPQDSGCWESTGSQTSYGSTDGIRISTSDGDYTSGDYIYIKVEGYFSTTTGSYSLYLY